MKYKLQDLLDMGPFQNMQDRLNEIYSFPSAIIDNEGNILTATAWQDICTQFHRKNKDSERDCLKSDQYIRDHLHEANPALSYRCPRGLVDNAAPIIIDGIHYGNFFTGQFFLEKPDLEFFRSQAKKYGFDEKAYLEAVKKVPIWTQEQLNSYLFFIKGLIAIISESVLTKLKEIETRKQIEASEERYGQILKTSLEGIWILNEERRVTFVNKRFTDMLGYTPEEILGKRVDWFMFEEDLEDSALRGDMRLRGVAEIFERRLRRKDGSTIWIIVSSSPLFDSQGRFTGAFAMFTDITDHKQAEEALRVSERTAQRLAKENELIAEIGRIISSTLDIEDVYQRFADKVREAISFDRIAVNTINMKNYTRTIAYVQGDRFSGNRIGEEFSIAGTGIEQAMRTKSSLLIDSQSTEDMKRKVIAAYQFGAQSTMIIPLILKDRVIGSLAVHSAQIDAYSEEDLRLAERMASQIAGAIANAQLFLQCRQVEEALRESEKAARLLAQENELLAEIGKIISSTINIEDAYELFAEKLRMLIPFDRIAVNTINIKDNTRFTRYVKGDTFADGQTGEVLSFLGTRTEQVVRTKSGLLFNSKSGEDKAKIVPGTLSVRFGAQSTIIVPLISKDEVIGTMAVHSVKKDAYSEKDLFLAERVGSQIAGAMANALLFGERKQIEEERENLKERLHRAEKMEALGTLAGGVAHDLNNVLGVLSGYSELLMERLPAGNPLRDYAANIFESSEKGAAIIQDLLTLARRGVVVSKVVDFNSVIFNLLATMEFDRLKDYHPQVVVKTDLEKDLLKIKGSPVHLEKTLFNLVSNAVEAIFGQGEVSIRTENRYLDKAVRGYDQVAEGDYVVLTVSDSGDGIPAADLGKIFEPFYTKKSMGRSGTGLGLAIVWGTVKDHDGYIDVRSIEGRGTTFTLYFPVTREAMGEETPKIAVEQYIGYGESVLVVDDVREQRQVATALLLRLGYRVNSVASGEEAVEYLRENTTDILVLDMIMEPGIDGLETYRRLIEINPYQKAVIVSGFSESEQVRAAQKLGAGAYVKKPYVMEKIGVAIREELSKATGNHHCRAQDGLDGIADNRS